MRILFASILTIQLLAACSPASSLNSPALLQLAVPELQALTGETEKEQPAINTVSLPIATALPTQTPNPISLDRDGYRKFALLRNHYPGFVDYRADTELFRNLKFPQPGWQHDGCFRLLGVHDEHHAL